MFTEDVMVSDTARGPVIVAVAVFTQPAASVTVTVYVPLVSFVAVALVCPPGLQEYVYPEPPVAVAVAELRPHEPGVTVVVTLRAGLTVTLIVLLPLQPPEIPEIVYVVVEPGLAVTVATLVALNPVAGLQVYVVAPLAVKLIPVPPIQIFAEGGVMVTVRDEPTTTLTVWVPVQPAALVPVTVYVVVTPGLAITVAPVVPLNPVAGAHVYVDALEAVSDTFPPVQIDGAAGETDTTGAGFTVTATVEVPVHPAVLPVTVYVVLEAGFALTVARLVALSPVAGDHV